MQRASLDLDGSGSDLETRHELGTSGAILPDRCTTNLFAVSWFGLVAVRKVITEK
jgi:hypothetical protein